MSEQSISDPNIPDIVAVTSGTKWLIFDGDGTRRIARASAAQADAYFRRAQFPGFVANNWYLPLGMTLFAAGAPQTANSATLYPAIIAQKCTIGNLGAKVSTLHAGALFDLALYNTDFVTPNPNRPGALVGGATSLSATANGIVTAALSGGNQQIDAGVYWFYFNTNDTTAVWNSWSSNCPLINQLAGGTSAHALANSSESITVAQAQGSLPSTLIGASFVEAAAGPAVPYIGFQPVSIP
jgi:hypothetical protein